MAKQKFNPDVLKDRTPSGGLKPLDFMRPMEEDPALDDAVVPDPPSPDVTPAPRESVRAPERKSGSPTPSPAPGERPIYLTPVDTSEKPFNRGFHMYPSRHRQLQDLEYIEGRRPWEIIEQALAEYVKRHYPGKAGR